MSPKKGSEDTENNRPASREEILKILRAAVASAREESKIASEAFDNLVADAPSGLPYPDSTYRIRTASIEYAAGRTRVLSAMARLNAFVLHGVVPEDLKGP